MAAIDETWCANTMRTVLDITREDMRETICLAYGTDEDVNQRVKLMACAPEALRMLQNENLMSDGCPFCFSMWKIGDGGVRILLHWPACQWLALMKKAGLR